MNQKKDTMKTKSVMLLAAAFCAAATLNAEKIAAGPKGGRLLNAEPLRAEFVVGADRKAEVRFYDATLKPAAPDAQAVAITAEPASGRVKLEVVKTADGFVTKDALPAGEPYRVVVQIRSQAEAKPQNFRIDLNLGNCGGCSRAEYACTCESH
jgi:hypothetical protein